MLAVVITIKDGGQTYLPAEFPKHIQIVTQKYKNAPFLWALQVER